MTRRNGTTRPGGIPPPSDLSQAKRRQRNGVRRMLCALAELAHSRGQLAHVPTLMQVRALAHFDGCEPCSYLLDPQVNYVPELPLGGKESGGAHGLCFTGHYPDSGRRFELVALPDGCAFDLLGTSG